VRRRFFVEQFADGRSFMEGEAAHHLGRVLRAQTGQLYELSDGERVWLGRIDKVGRERIEFVLVEELPAYRPALDLTLLLAVVKFDAFEWALEKATELGVNTIVPLATARTEKALLVAAGKRAERWKKILAEASQQSRRLSVPTLEAVTRPEEIFASARNGLRLLLSENRNAPSMRQALAGQKAASVAIAIGPEGGWTENEFDAARQSGFQQVSLGKLILRTETAVIAALASLNYALGGE
jgi:16S rRNA (uracil1498-N3)-methyltransferase